MGEGYLKAMNLRAIDPPLVDEENFIITRLGNDLLAAAIDAELVKIMQTKVYEDLRTKFKM